MFKKIQCRVIASAVLDNGNVPNDEILIESNRIVNNFPKPSRAEKLTYTKRSNTIKVNYNNSHAGKLLDLLF